MRFRNENIKPWNAAAGAVRAGRDSLMALNKCVYQQEAAVAPPAKPIDEATGYAYNQYDK